MATQETPSHSDKIKTALAKRAETITARADANLAMMRDENNGRLVAKVSPEQWAEILDKIEAGCIEARICREYGITAGAIWHKRRNDPSFAAAYDRATKDGAVAVLKNTRAIAAGDEGYSSGSITRDMLMVKTDIDVAKRLNPAEIGDRQMIDQRQIVFVQASDLGDI